MISDVLKQLRDVEGERGAGGRLLQVRGPATANARSTILERRVDGTTRSAERKRSTGSRLSLRRGVQERR